MNTGISAIARGAALGFLILAGAINVRAAGPYYFLREIAIGGQAGTPSLAIDSDARRLYITHSTKIEVIDLEKGEVTTAISNTPSVRGFTVAPKLGRGYSSNPRSATASIIELQSGKITGKAKTGGLTDAMLFEPAAGQVYAFNSRPESATVFDATTGAAAATIDLPGKPGFAAADPSSARVYCAIVDRNILAAIDTKTRAVTAWPVSPGKEPCGIAVDPDHHRVFLGCRNKMLLMIDDATGKTAASVPVGSGVDQVAFDPTSQLAICANSDGTATIAHEDAPDKLTVVQSLQTERNAHVLALDPKTRKFYLATTDFVAQPEPEPGAPITRPHVIPGTLKILVYGPAPQ